MRAARRRLWIYVLLFLLVAINYMDRSALSVAATPISKEFGLTPGQMGLLLSAFLWSYLLCLIPAGIITDRMGTRWTNAISIAVWSAATVLVGVVRGFGALVGARLLMGIGESTTYPACGRVVQEWAPAAERGRVVATYNSGAYAGPALGSIVTAALVTEFGWRIAFVILGAVGFGWLAAWLVWFRDPAKARWLSTEERDKILRERGLARQAEETGGLRAGVLELLRWRSMWGVTLVQSAAVYTQYMFLTWLPGYLEQVHNLSVLKSGAFTAIPYVVAMVLGIALGVVFDRMLDEDAVASGKRRLMVAGCLLLSSVVLITPFVSSMAVILGLISVSMTFVSSAVSMNLALLADLLRSPRLAGRANSIALIGGNAFGLAAPIVTGYVVQITHGYTTAFLVAGFFLLLGMSVSLTMTRKPIGDEPTFVASAPLSA
ncbi:MFS transporter [Saccharopolyspora sp. K220]|uniref:MFS transporter n=1 Tax=Saccharopolyspora soli TaxID=2926618 RepID=UPI001F596A53|nr:MFS transporter [Saccharopolyspora soli]MCI2422336.1 MFS transporter [Saccharopolyspora soli]